MARFLVRRLLPLPVVLLGVTVLVFFISTIVPSDPVALALGEQATPEQREALRDDLGLDDPAPLRYWRYLENLVQGDWGTSLVTRRPVLTDLRQAVPASLELTTAAMLVALGVGVPLGIIGARYGNRWPDYLSRMVSLVGMSLERAWVAVLVQLVIATSIGFPINGRFSGGPAPPEVTGLLTVDSLLAGDLGALVTSLRHLTLPALALSLGALAQISRITRARMLEEQGQEYVQTNAAQGLRQRTVTLKYTFRNALPVILSVSALSYGALLGNAFLVETVFGWPGIGQYGVAAILNNDLPGIAGVTLLLGVVFVVANTAVDIVHASIDPRLRFGR